MLEKLNELISKTHELRNEVREVFKKINSDYPYIYVRKKGIRVPYTYTKYDTKYLIFDYDTGFFCIKFGEGKVAGFNLGKYKKTWAFSKDDFE